MVLPFVGRLFCMRNLFDRSRLKIFENWCRGRGSDRNMDFPVRLVGQGAACHRLLALGVSLSPLVDGVAPSNSGHGLYEGEMVQEERGGKSTCKLSRHAISCYSVPKVSGIEIQGT